MNGDKNAILFAYKLTGERQKFTRKFLTKGAHILLYACLSFRLSPRLIIANTAFNFCRFQRFIWLALFYLFITFFLSIFIFYSTVSPGKSMWLYSIVLFISPSCLLNIESVVVVSHLLIIHFLHYIQTLTYYFHVCLPSGSTLFNYLSSFYCRSHFLSFYHVHSSKCLLYFSPHIRCIFISYVIPSFLHMVFFFSCFVY